VTLEQVESATSFPLARAADLRETPAPTAEQLRMIRTVLDPHVLRATVFK
jgi:glutaconate CoA-transferase subunit B